MIGRIIEFLMLHNLSKDFLRVYHKELSPTRRLFNALFNYGFIAIAVYRFGKLANRIPVPVVSHVLKMLYLIDKFLVEVLFGITIDVNSNIGPGFYIGHFGGIIVRGDFGSQCSIGQGVTVGSKGAGKSDGWPVIGDNVYIGAGAKIIGSIKVGNDCVIGANAVVIRDVPGNSLAVGVPATYKSL